MIQKTCVIKSEIRIGNKPADTHPHNWPMHLQWMCRDIAESLTKMFIVTVGEEIVVNADPLPKPSRHAYLVNTIEFSGAYLILAECFDLVEREVNEMIEMHAGDNNVPITGSVKFMPVHMGYPYDPAWQDR